MYIMLKRLNALMLLMLGIGIFLSCNKDKTTTINDASDIIGEWKAVELDFYYDGELVFILTPDSKEHFYYISQYYDYGGYDITHYDSFDIADEAYVFGNYGECYWYYIYDDKEADKINYTWLYQNNRIILTYVEDDPDTEYLYVSDNYLTEEWGRNILGYYISDSALDLSWRYEEIPDIDWKGQDGKEHEMKVILKFAKQ